MSIMDTSLEFCDAVDVSGATGSALIGDVVDMGRAQELGDGYQLHLVISVSTAFAGGATQFTLASDDSASVATDGSATEHVKTGALAAAALPAGATIILPLPMGQPYAERYLGLFVTRSGSTVSAGGVNAYLTMDPPQWRSYPDAVN